VHDLFDIVCGTSTGGILAALFAVKRTPVQEAGRLYDELIKKVFNKVGQSTHSLTCLLVVAIRGTEGFIHSWASSVLLFS